MNSTVHFEMIYFYHPVWLYLFILFIIIFMLATKIKSSNLLQQLTFKYTYHHPYYPLLTHIANQKHSKNQRAGIYVNKIVYLILPGLLFLSLAEPYQRGQKIPDPPVNRDIAFLVDNEVSMVLKDYFIDEERVERLTMVKSVLINFANKLAGNRISLITFSEEAHTLLPFTTDSGLVKAMIPRITATLTGRTSNPQKALLYTLNYLHNTRLNTDTSTPSIVLITGVLRPPRDIDPVIIAKYIKQKGYKLYVIAIGSSTYKDSDVNNSTLIYHPASFERLKSIAEAANGEFYRAESTASLTGVIQKILASKKVKIKSEAEYTQIPLFQWPLGLFLILLLAHYIISSLTIRKSNA